ncbi:MFS general substrate transporter [Xylariaceae sp. FL0804]|nr:MFS general substrate transporter [Xylariaceae sp. FL0804]
MAEDEKSDVAAAPAAVSAPVPVPDEKSLAHSRDLDDTYELYRGQDARDLDPDEARRVLRKIDRHVLPLLMGTYCLQFLDKSAIGYASVFGLQDGTHLRGQQYSWLTSIFYIAYMLAQPVAGILLQKLPVGKFIGVTSIAWGILQITTPACTSFAGIAANRFLLGAFEAVVNPGFVLVLGMWWRADEQPLRMTAYYCMNGWAGVFGGLLGYAIGHIRGGLASWQYVFIIFGAVSLAWSAVFLALMPDLPATARFLGTHERAVAVDRVAANRAGVKNRHFKRYQMWQCFRDPKTWILFVMSVAAQIPNAANTSFTSIILETFGFTTLQTQYMQIPGSVIQIVSLLVSGWISSRWPNMRCLTMLVCNLICVACAAVLVGLPAGSDGTEHKWGRLVALWLTSVVSVGFSMSLTMVSSNIAGYTKKQLTGAILFIGYCVGNIIGPQTFIESEAPLYTSAYVALLIGYTIKTVMVVVLWVYMWMVNKKRDREAAISGSHLTDEQEREAIEKGMQDMTELDNKGFRYVL